MRITIAYTTARREPMFRWFVESLIRQYPDGHVTDEVIIVDAWLEYSHTRRAELAAIVNGRFEYIHTPPKPSIWRGKHRKTKRNFYDSAGSKNTAFVIMSSDYCVIMDDLSYLLPGWLDYHRFAAENRWVFSGQFCKGANLVFDGVELKSWDVHYPDCRIKNQADLTKPIQSWGGWCFGSNTGAPLQAILDTGGKDEFLARAGGEDCDWGVRLENAGWKPQMFFDSRCAYVEDELLHYTGPNEVDESYCLRAFKSIKETEENQETFKAVRRWLDSETHPRLYQQRNPKPRDPHFNLIAERELYRATRGFKSVDHIEWTDPDGQDISEL